jgi:putative spermidine/putrescine transport system substrate-binding protein
MRSNAGRSLLRTALPALVALAATLLLACGGGGGDGDGGGPAESFAEIRRDAQGQTVRWWMYGGDDRINRYVDEIVIPAAREAGVRLERVPVGDTADALQRVIAQRRAGRESGGAVDLIWINGENFAAGKEAGLWLEDWVRALPNARFVDFTEPTIAKDFQVPVEGQEAPWYRAAFALAHDSRKLDEPPHSYAALLGYARRNPGRFTYPAPPDFTGSAFVRQVVAAMGEDRAFAYLRELEPLMYRRGETFPASTAELDALFANGEVDFAMSYEANFVAAQVERGMFARSTRPFILGEGALVNVSYVTIPADAAHESGAQVVANLLMSPALQAKQADPEILGVPTVLDVDSLPADLRGRFDELADNPYALSDFGKVQQELPADRIEPLEQRWEREILRGD